MQSIVDTVRAKLVETAQLVLEGALLQAAAEDPESAGVLTLAVEAGASLSVSVEFPKVGHPSINARVTMPNGDTRDFVRITAEPVRGH